MRERLLRPVNAYLLLLRQILILDWILYFPMCCLGQHRHHRPLHQLLRLRETVLFLKADHQICRRATLRVRDSAVTTPFVPVGFPVGSHRTLHLTLLTTATYSHTHDCFTGSRDIAS